jgi:uncharacterized protein (DUF1778 family)
MTASAHDELPLPHRKGFIGFRTTGEQELAIRKAAELFGWSVSQYVLCAVLDQAERDLHEHAARIEWEAGTGSATAEPLESLIMIHSDL